jgi:hypothetical protein
MDKEKLISKLKYLVAFLIGAFFGSIVWWLMIIFILYTGMNELGIEGQYLIP